MTSAHSDITLCSTDTYTSVFLEKRYPLPQPQLYLEDTWPIPKFSRKYQCRRDLNGKSYSIGIDEMLKTNKSDSFLLDDITIHSNITHLHCVYSACQTNCGSILCQDRDLRCTMIWYRGISWMIVAGVKGLVVINFTNRFHCKFWTAQLLL